MQTLLSKELDSTLIEHQPDRIINAILAKNLMNYTNVASISSVKIDSPLWFNLDDQFVIFQPTLNNVDRVLVERKLKSLGVIILPGLHLDGSRPIDQFSVSLGHDDSIFKTVTADTYNKALAIAAVYAIDYLKERSLLV